MEIARAKGWDSTCHAEYLAVARLQADALITVDPVMAAIGRDVVPLAGLETAAPTRQVGLNCCV